MPLTSVQKEIALKFLQEFVEAGMMIENQGAVVSMKEFVRARIEGIPEIAKLLNDFWAGTIGISAFKELNSKMSIKHNYWGFTGFSGQMSLNQFANWSEGSEKMERLLRKGLRVPADRKEAETKMRLFIEELPKCLPSEKKIRIRSIPFFLSYFWQIQEPDRIPVYYVSARRILEEQGWLAENEDPTVSFISYWALFDALAELFEENPSRKEINRYWFVEHVLWFQVKKRIAEAPQAKADKAAISPVNKETKLPYMAFVPPVVANLNDAGIEKNGGADFENMVAVLFRMLGFQVEVLGQGAGRNPDGIAKCRSENFAILWDAKAYKDGFNIGTDDRKAIEYIRNHEKSLQRDGYQRMYFVYVSPSFSGSNSEAIDRIRRQTSVKSVVLLSAGQALRLLAKRISDPLGLDMDSLESILIDSGLLSEDRLEQVLQD